MKDNLKLLAVITGLILVQSAYSIVIRHDIDDSNYQESAATYSTSLAYTDYCAFTLIATDWLLTAAHCMVGDGRIPFDVIHMGTHYRVSQIAIHPDFDADIMVRPH